MLPLPKVGETWTDTHSGVEGIVAWVDGTTVTFVSLTGVRAAVGFNRQYTTWQFKRAAPECWQECSRRFCSDHAFLRYERPRQAEPEVVCPNHAPRGVQSQVLTQKVAAASFLGKLCWNPASCSGVEANEVLNEVLPSNTTFWLCPRCGTYCVHASRDRRLIVGQDLNAVAQQAVPEGYRLKSQTHQIDSLREAVAFQITVVPGAFTAITGPKPLTLFDHLLMADDE